MTIRPESKLTMLLGRLSTTHEDLIEATRLVESTQLDLKSLVDLVRRSKVLPVFLANILQIRTNKVEELLGAFDRFKHQLEPQVVRTRQISGLLALSNCLGEQAENLMAIKGSALFFLVPDYELRSLGDIDLMYPNLKELFEATRHLLRNGYYIKEGGEAPWICNFATGEGTTPDIEGHFTVVGPHVGFDLHSRNMSNGSSLLRTDLWKRARRMPLENRTILVPSPEDTLLILVTHSVNHGYFTLKDFNDSFIMISRYGSSMDWEYLVKELKRHGLDRLFSYLIATLADDYGLSNPIPVAYREAVRPAGGIGHWIERGGLLAMAPPWYLAAMSSGVMAVECIRPECGFLKGAATVWQSFISGARNQEGLLPEFVQQRLRAKEYGPFFHQQPAPHVQIFLAEISMDLLHEWVALDFEWSDLEPLLRNAGYEVTSYPEVQMVTFRQFGVEIVLTPAGLYTPTRNFVFTKDELDILEVMAKEVIYLVRTGLQEKSV